MRQPLQQAIMVYNLTLAIVVIIMLKEVDWHCYTICQSINQSCKQDHRHTKSDYMISRKEQIIKDLRRMNQLLC